LYSFGFVSQLFFPESAMKKVMVDYWAPQGTRIETVSENLTILEGKLLKDERVEHVSTFVGAGPPRFYLPVDPEKPNSSYGQIIINVHDHKDIDDLIKELTPWVADQYPDAIIPLRKYGLGPSNTWKFEYRISGPARVDSGELRTIAAKGFEYLEKEPLAGLYQSDWRQKTQVIEPIYNQERARWSAVTRRDIANTTKRAYDGRIIGLYRERDNLIPIIMRNIESERQNVAAMDVLQLTGAFSVESFPVSQVVDGIQPKWEDPIIQRRDRRPTLTIQANPIPGETLAALMKRVGDKFEAIEVPPGYTLEWGGEKEDSYKAQASLIPGVIPSVALMAIIIVALFNAFKPPLVIVLTIPFALIGITFGLLATNVPFGFVALLAAMSLAGMMIKNAIVLLDQANINIEEGQEQYDAIIDAAVSRLRPVVLAAATTVLGVIPLLQDVFWVGMAVVIMAGLTFGTVLTMVLVPVFYATLYKLSHK
jgi:multidrug efflux pump subunit AcrB